jgi:hypothetical protein
MRQGFEQGFEFVSPTKLRRSLIAMAAAMVLTGGAAQAQNLDEGKTAPQLFANGCSTCHRSPRGLAHGRISLTLFMFLQQHYSTSSSSARALTSYLESVDDAGHGPSRPKGTKRSSAAPHPPAAASGHP